jgi:hypothetical protein
MRLLESGDRKAPTLHNSINIFLEIQSTVLAGELSLSVEISME